MIGATSPESLLEFIQQRDNPDWSVQIHNRSESDAVQRMVTGLFDSLAVETAADGSVDTDEDVVVLLDGDDDVVSTSSIGSLKETLLMVNSDLYTTGTRSLEEIDPPDVITALSDTQFHLEGYPYSNTEKLVLILISRYVERRALACRGGTLRSKFQELSTVDDELGTRRVYERLGATDVDGHVYGLPADGSLDHLDVTVHEGTSEEYRRTWAVTYQSDTSDGSVAMVAYQTGPNRWTGCWTFDEDDVRAIDRYIERDFSG